MECSDVGWWKWPFGWRHRTPCRRAPTLLRLISREPLPAVRTFADVTGKAFAELNANHAHGQARVTKAAALELLRRNSRNAAAAVRAFTDEELDRALPSLIGLVET